MPSATLHRRAALTLSVGGGIASLARPALAQGGAGRTLRFVPHANLAALDPLWSSALISFAYAYMAYDQLYGLDETLTPRPQMLAGHELSDDGLRWRLTLREGLLFHDGEPVRAADCVASIRRWTGRDPFGLRLAALVEEMRPLDDRRLEIRLRRPFPQLPYGLGATACFIMPERVAATTEASRAVTEAIGSGPFRFLRDEWVSGSRAAFSRFDRYQPRPEPPSFWSGGKAAQVERVEWHILPDPATAAAAVQRGEVDWLERPLLDLVPTLRRARGLRVEVVERAGFCGMLAFNLRIPPFDDPAMRRALLPAIRQADFMQAIVGDQPDLTRTGVGVFLPGSPAASDAGLAALTGPRSLDLARRRLREAGYAGEPVVQMLPTDLPAPNAMGQVMHALLRELGVNVQLQAMDWGTVISRVQGASSGAAQPWHVYAIAWAGLWLSNPGGHQPLYGTAPNPRMEALRDAWFEAPDAAAQRAVTESMQRLALEEPPMIPVGQYFVPHVVRADVSGIVPAPSTVFWGVRKG